MLNCAKVSSRQKKLVLHDIWSFLYTLADGLRGQYFEVVFASKYICATLQYKYNLLEYFCIGCVFSVVSIHYPPSIFVQWHKRKITKGPFSKEALFIPDGSAVQLRIIIPQRLHQYMCIMRSFCFPFVTQKSFFFFNNSASAVWFSDALPPSIFPLFGRHQRKSGTWIFSFQLRLRSWRLNPFLMWLIWMVLIRSPSFMFTISPLGTFWSVAWLPRDDPEPKTGVKPEFYRMHV